MLWSFSLALIKHLIRRHFLLSELYFLRSGINLPVLRIQLRLSLEFNIVLKSRSLRWVLTISLNFCRTRFLKTLNKVFLFQKFSGHLIENGMFPRWGLRDTIRLGVFILIFEMGGFSLKYMVCDGLISLSRSRWSVVLNGVYRYFRVLPLHLKGMLNRLIRGCWLPDHCVSFHQRNKIINYKQVKLLIK